MDKIVYTVSEVAEILKVNKNYVYDLIRNKKLKALKLNSYRIRHESLIEFLEQNDGQEVKFSE